MRLLQRERGLKRSEHELQSKCSSVSAVQIGLEEQKRKLDRRTRCVNCMTEWPVPHRA